MTRIRHEPDHLIGGRRTQARRTTGCYLKAADFTYDWHAEEKQALAALCITPPDLMLPGLDGLEICRAVRTCSVLPIIMVTSPVDKIERLLSLELGVDNYICKPFSPRE